MTRGLIKICGVTTADDAALAAELGVDLIGVNLYPQSPRYALPQNVPSILEAIGDRAEGIAVLVEPTKESLLGPAVQLTALQTIQWHGAGHEPRPWLTRQLIAAFGIAGQGDLAVISQYVALCRREGCLPRAILIDAVAHGLHGGTGKTAPWQALAGFDPGVPIILAGGLKPENVAEAIRTVRPHGVDVASGVEEVPGRKSREKMRRFVEAAREAFERN